MGASVFDDVVQDIPGEHTGLSKVEKFLSQEFHKICHDESLDGFSEKTQKLLAPAWRLCTCIMLGFFLWYNYSSDRSSKFLSLDGSDSSQECEEVPLSVSKTLLMDVEGYWNGNSLYNPSRAVYSFETNNFKHNTSMFVNIINDLRSRISNVANQALTRTLPDNLLYWMSWAQIIDDNGASMRLQFTGSILNVFDRWAMQAVLGNVAADCRSIPKVAYNPLSGVLDVTYSAQDYSSQGSCTKISAATNLG
jgi:hypothetical protein